MSGDLKHNMQRLIDEAYNKGNLAVLEELIDPNHPVRVVNQVVDNLNLDPILVKYDGGGCPA